MSESVTTSILATDQLRVDTLQFFLLVGRLPSDLAAHFVGVTGEPRDLAAMACLMFAGAGIVWPIPCLARQFDGGWFNVIDVCDDEENVRQQ